MKIEVVFGNIVKQPDVDAIVNSANANLRLGSGVAGAIHTAAGPRLEEYCRPYAPLELGAALITPGFQLSTRYLDALTESGFLVKQKIGRGNYYVNSALTQILLNQHNAP